MSLALFSSWIYTLFFFQWVPPSSQAREMSNDSLGQGHSLKLIGSSQRHLPFFFFLCQWEQTYPFWVFVTNIFLKGYIKVEIWQKVQWLPDLFSLHYSTFRNACTVSVTCLLSAICCTCMVASANIWCCNSNWGFSCKLLVLLTSPEREGFLGFTKVRVTHSPSLWEGMILSLEAYLSSKSDTYV